MTNIRLILLLLLFTVIKIESQNIYCQSPADNRRQIKIHKKLKSWNNSFLSYQSMGNITIDSVKFDKKGRKLKVCFNPGLANIPVREEIIENAISSIRKFLGRKYNNYDIDLFAGKSDLKELVPNYLRQKISIDQARFKPVRLPVKPFIIKKYHLEPELGLLGANIALWHSHGRYYEAKLDRWEWQRARLHSTVEDIFPMSFVLDYIDPMLANAGANVFIPRERDINCQEVIIDNDGSTARSSIIIPEYYRVDTINEGFRMKDTLFNNENPFRLGTYLKIQNNASKKASVRYIADFPESGDYAVYISYGKGGPLLVNYIVNYSGGYREFQIDQTRGAGTWIFLGTFYFEKGLNAEIGSVVVESTFPFTSDAVKFGGGMGNVARRPSNEIIPDQWSLSGQKKEIHSLASTFVDPESFTWKLSNMPRYMEGARYFLQYSGMPDSTVYSLTKGKNDYNDDYQSRPEWVNYLNGNPETPFKPVETGLNIPFDAALAFHTDAGITRRDTVIGTLAIYSSNKPDTLFPNGQSKMVNRDFADMIQTQITDDISDQYDINWARRALWDRPYSEAWRPNCPAMLLELLSHQNLGDMKYGLDPRFRFIVSRSIYKALLKFLAFQDNRPYIVQPLPVTNFSISMLGNSKVRLSWKAVLDITEPTAVPEAYVVYSRTEGRGFDQGILVRDTFVDLEIPLYERVYSYRVTALNKGGESFPSEILSAGLTKKSDRKAVIVNAFDRICGPDVHFDSLISGVAYWKDFGVPYKRDFSFTGYPYDFNFKNPWTDDDNPGWGASFSDKEGSVIAGNTFDYPFIHGKSILNAGVSFISSSDEAFANKDFDIKGFDFADIIFGEEKTTTALPVFNMDNYKIFNESMREKLKEMTRNGTDLFISGSYIGSDNINSKDSISEKFVSEILHYKWRTSFASKTGIIKNTDIVKSHFQGDYHFNTELRDKIYMVESPDGIEPADGNAVTCFRYDDSGAGAAIVYRGDYKVVAFGFPFETILDSGERDRLMQQIISFFKN